LDDDDDDDDSELADLSGGSIQRSPISGEPERAKKK